ncbi:MAG: hypothetical protein ABIH35_03080 [Patescibacteria group bacterium]
MSSRYPHLESAHRNNTVGGENIFDTSPTKKTGLMPLNRACILRAIRVDPEGVFLGRKTDKNMQLELQRARLTSLRIKLAFILNQPDEEQAQ